MEWIRKYKYTLGFLLSVIVAVALFATGAFDVVVGLLDGYGYIGALIAGFLFPFTFTAAGAGLFLVELAGVLHPLLIALFAGVGAMCADLIMYRFFQASIIHEIRLLLTKIIPPKRLERMERVTKKKVWAWGIPFLASILIASPLPDEIGMALFGVVNFRPRYLSALTFLLNTAGIFLLVLIGYSVHS